MGELFPNQELDEAVAPLCVVCLEVGWPLRSLDRFLKFATAGRLLFLSCKVVLELVPSENGTAFGYCRRGVNEVAAIFQA